MNRLSFNTTFALAILVILVTAGYFSLPWELRQNDVSSMANPASVNCVTKGGQVDIRAGYNGGQVGYCLFSDKSQCEEWALFMGECSQRTITDAQPIAQQLLSEKYGARRIKSVIVNQATVAHMRGDVIFKSTADQAAAGGQDIGGYFLAAKVSGTWRLVADGNGQISCALMESYDFPSFMVGDCAN